MSTVELIQRKAEALPRELQIEALHYLEYLAARQEVRSESADWAKFSAAQLENHYAPSDAIYDQE